MSNDVHFLIGNGRREDGVKTSGSSQNKKVWLKQILIISFVKNETFQSSIKEKWGGFCPLTSTLPFLNVKTSRILTPRADGSQQNHKAGTEKRHLNIIANAL